ncbi:conserved hypothetical protein [Mucor ambiguus]|uniref:EamA domain-containing protein n=1 Tax=Mucor ambiguus TaxID=91626 RepID=A0A0C9MHZ4_9FUNG|nr:conserved hypothetical protein [Mucor ambiguus]
MGALVKQQRSISTSYQIILHQIGFLLTGLCTTLGVQWLFYRGAATSMSLLPQLSSYTGMLLVGLFVPILLQRKEQMALQYKLILSEEETDSHHLFKDHLVTSKLETQDQEDDLKLPTPAFMKEEGPIPHFAIIKLASLEIIASFALTIGFSIIGSGMYQVIYSSVVIWCAIFTWFFMGRALSRVQWMAIIGTSVGLGISSLDSIRGSPLQEDAFASAQMDQEDATRNVLFNGTLMTLGGTLVSACIYVYADNILSKTDRQPLPARVCCWMGIYTSLFTWLWISVYTLPQFDEIIHVDAETSTATVIAMYLLVTIANALHSWSHYELIERTGNVATGILQGLRAILVYSISHVWYCQEDSAQCKSGLDIEKGYAMSDTIASYLGFTAPKGCGSLIVIGCVLVFTLGKK